MHRDTQYAEFEAECVAETAQALLVEIDGKKYWVPKSVVRDDSTVQAQDDDGTLIIEEWFATKQGIE